MTVKNTLFIYSNLQQALNHWLKLGKVIKFDKIKFDQKEWLKPKKILKKSFVN